ncbi:hypothetical protein SAMN05216474_2555 [Lishizhenia tianjinensis]|uniref:PEGA domain-containing protein n=1 Tax=Lishizhenia tianjinensis TaxID=477690 RepID=A0A1I7B4V2_9FLAO|nr:hypothetical protein [Lishizhenia tianjinensis]SFT82230.1 hypothetical protein SAMN05216474_2555 [Lishizhenia tianjinensis]
MTQLIINRSSAWANKLRDIKIYLDDVEITQIADGCSQTLNLPPGDYVVHAKIDWCSSKRVEVSLQENEQKEIVLSGFKCSNYLFLAFGIMILGMYLYDGPLVYGFNPFALGVLGAGLVFSYFLTLGRKQYLQLNPQT